MFINKDQRLLFIEKTILIGSYPCVLYVLQLSLKLQQHLFSLELATWFLLLLFQPDHCKCPYQCQHMYLVTVNMLFLRFSSFVLSAALCVRWNKEQFFCPCIQIKFEAVIGYLLVLGFPLEYNRSISITQHLVSQQKTYLPGFILRIQIDNYNI